MTSKEKLSLTRKLVGYRDWRQRWCKKEGNKVLGGKILYLAHVNLTEPKEVHVKYRIFVIFLFLKQGYI